MDKEKVMGAIRPVLESRKGLCLDTEWNHQGFRETIHLRIEYPWPGGRATLGEKGFFIKKQKEL